MKTIYILLVVFLFSCGKTIEKNREYINLEGQWQFALDTAQIGQVQKWYGSDLRDSINLPGTTDLYQKGFRNKDTSTLHLNRVNKYEGVAWYRKKVLIPNQYKEKHIQLVLERTKPSKVWIDSTFVGESFLLQSPQVFNVSDYLIPGEHYITIQVNNDLKLTPYNNVHIYSDDTQTNWNGIIGELYIEVSEKTYISNLQVYPDIDKKKIDIELNIDNQLNVDRLNIELWVEKTINGKTTRLKPLKLNRAFQAKINLEYALNEACSLWDEYEQPIYHLTAVIASEKFKDSKTVVFGMRKFSAEGTQFSINGRTTFLRGKHEAAVFPLTGFPPMNVDDWVRVYKIAKSYGINHYRFHSYCPPEAAFAAADQEGIYLQAELPFWGELDSDSVANMLKAEGYGMLQAFANHPSFVMFSHGNEIGGGHDRVERNIVELKAFDNRPLYTMGSNNSVGFAAPKECSDFFIGARTPFDYDTVLTHTRLAQCFADSKEGGILNTQTPSAEIDFSYSVSHMNIPIISHEIGQYQTYPDYKEIDKYTGVLRAWNLIVFRDRLEKAGMIEMDSAFHKASGAWAALCYKAEMEAAFRTRGFAGFQLLDLQDFPGQGTALVGILDAFMDSKSIISPENWKQSCNDVVVLLEFPKFCWTNTENFHAKLSIANYSNVVLRSDIEWNIRNQMGEILQQGIFIDSEIDNTGLSEIGFIDTDFKALKQAEKLTLYFAVSGTDYANSYDIWVYPSEEKPAKPDEILVVEKLNEQVIATLQNGGKVLFFPQTEDVGSNSFKGLFPPEFWNYGMFKGISEGLNKPVSSGTLGLLINPDHELFDEFPTEFHTNWQWFSIIKASRFLILDSTPQDYLPLVQVIDNLERNHKLGLIFEFKLGTGKILVCMSQLNKIMDKPEAAQLYKSIINYMDSDTFNPDLSIGFEEFTELFTK